MNCTTILELFDNNLKNNYIFREELEKCLEKMDSLHICEGNNGRILCVGNYADFNCHNNVNLKISTKGNVEIKRVSKELDSNSCTVIEIIGVENSDETLSLVKREINFTNMQGNDLMNENIFASTRNQQFTKYQFDKNGQLLKFQTQNYPIQHGKFAIHDIEWDDSLPKNSMMTCYYLDDDEVLTVKSRRENQGLKTYYYAKDGAVDEIDFAEYQKLFARYNEQKEKSCKKLIYK